MPNNENDLNNTLNNVFERALDELRREEEERREYLNRGIVRLEPEESDFGGFWDITRTSDSSFYNAYTIQYLGDEIMPRNTQVQTFPLTWEAVNNSKAVKALAYNKRDKVLYVLFTKGQLYSYNEVTEYKFNKIAEASLLGGVGEYLNKSIIGMPEKHPCTLLGQKSE